MERPFPQDPRAAFRAAYRLARLAFRGATRQALSTDLQMQPDYSAGCRRCNAALEVTRKVAAAIGAAGPHSLELYSQAARIALGETPPRQINMPGRLDFDIWQAWRAWAAEVREAA